MAKYFLGSFMIILFFSACNKEEVFKTPTITDYFPLQVGKYITYNLDSSLFTNFGQTLTVNHYQAQDRVDAQITDNLGRASYRIIRYIRQNDSQPWVANNTFMVTPTNNSIEYDENNLRFIKLILPVRQDYSWKGNKYINTTSLDPDLRYMDDWDYIYDSINIPLKINSLNIDSTIKVFERDEFLGEDPTNQSTQYAERTYSVEKYGKGIGLIYREFLHWEYQGPQPGIPGYYVGYGIKLSVVDHN
jgi:hypothetical protein